MCLQESCVTSVLLRFRWLLPLSRKVVFHEMSSTLFSLSPSLWNLYNVIIALDLLLEIFIPKLISFYNLLLFFCSAVLVLLLSVFQLTWLISCDSFILSCQILLVFFHFCYFIFHLCLVFFVFSNSKCWKLLVSFCIFILLSWVAWPLLWPAFSQLYF